VRAALLVTLLLGCGPTLKTAQELAERHELQPEAPIKAEASVVTSASLSTVWSIFSDVAGWPSWIEEAKDARIEGAFAAGTAFSYGSGARHQLRLAAVEPKTFVSFYGTLSGYVGITLWTFEALEPSGTRLTVRESNDGFLISLFYSQARLQQHLGQWVQALKAVAERAATPVLELMKAEEQAYSPLVATSWVKQWMRAVASLPGQGARVLYRTEDKKQAFTEEAAAKLPDGVRLKLQKRDADDDFYYGRITEPLGYARAFEVLARKAAFEPEGKRVLDFGYGNIGQLEGLVAVGARVGGIEVDPLLPLLYEKANRPALRLFHGYFPQDAALTRDVGQGWDLFISKNTLKRGYVHPPAPDAPQLPLDDDAFLAAVFNLLTPGGLFYIYNISPAPAPQGKPFMAWSDGRSPFTRELLERHGFEVLALDEDDTAAVRAMGKAFGWDRPEVNQPPTDLEHDLFAHYTLVRKVAAR
jgi:hypothetical protein